MRYPGRCVSELEKKDEARAAAEDAERKREHELQAGQAQAKRGKKPEEEDQPEPSIALGWDAEIDTFFERLNDFSANYRMSLSSTDFRTLTLYYREHSTMEKRVIANRLQRKGLHALLRALHAGDYRLYQDTWQTESEAVRDPQVSTHTDKP
jgi:hypothetical protein